MSKCFDGHQEDIFDKGGSTVLLICSSSNTLVVVVGLQIFNL